MLTFSRLKQRSAGPVAKWTVAGESPAAKTFLIPGREIAIKLDVLWGKCVPGERASRPFGQPAARVWCGPVREELLKSFHDAVYIGPDNDSSLGR